MLWILTILTAILPCWTARGAEKPQAGSQIPGIYPVYEEAGRWLLLPRNSKERKLAARKKARFVVIGSRGADLFHANGSTLTWRAACQGPQPVPSLGLWLSSNSSKHFTQVGTPIIAIALKPKARIDTSQAIFRTLTNQVNEGTYQFLGEPIRQELLNEIRSGNFPLGAEAPDSRFLIARPELEDVHIKIDFGTTLPIPGFKNPFLSVESAQIGASHRRCLRLSQDKQLLGSCVEMPHTLMAETSLLEFVAYYPNAGARPFVLAHTVSQPLWGHERWGFQITPQGPKLFLRDALDPRCREGF